MLIGLKRKETWNGVKIKNNLVWTYLFLKKPNSCLFKDSLLDVWHEKLELVQVLVLRIICTLSSLSLSNISCSSKISKWWIFSKYSLPLAFSKVFDCKFYSWNNCRMILWTNTWTSSGRLQIHLSVVYSKISVCHFISPRFPWKATIIKTDMEVILAFFSVWSLIDGRNSVCVDVTIFIIESFFLTENLYFLALPSLRFSIPPKLCFFFWVLD